MLAIVTCLDLGTYATDNKGQSLDLSTVIVMGDNGP